MEKPKIVIPTGKSFLVNSMIDSDDNIVIELEETKKTGFINIGLLYKNKDNFSPDFDLFKIIDNLKDGHYILLAQKMEVGK